MAKGFAYTVVGMRWFIVFGWMAAVAFAVLHLPALSSSGGLTDLVPPGSPAAHAEADATRLFGFPLDPGVAVVERDPHGMPSSAVTAAVRKAVAVDRTGSPIPGLQFAVPLPNNPALLSGTAEQNTSVLTYLVFRDGASFAAQVSGAEQYGEGAVTGLVPAQYEQGLIINRDLGRVELCTLVAIGLIVGIRFGSLGAPLVALTCSAAAYEISVRVVAWVAARENISLPPDLEPVLVVLLLGVTTDYSVFFLAGMRARLAEGMPRAQAARLATAEYAPITGAAGLLVAAGTASLVVARTQLLRAFGPGLGLTVLIAMTVSMTLCPALMAIFGKLLFARRYWGDAAAWTKLARFAATKPVALLIAAGCAAGLVACALGARQMGLGSPLINELPSSSSIVRASGDASAAFAPGILSPTEILAIGPVSDAGLARLEVSLRRQPGVAIVAGPTDLPSQLNPVNPMLAKGGGAARFAVVTTTDPLGSAAISSIRHLTSALPALGRQAGLTGVRFEVGGETALTSDAIAATTADLGRIALAVGIVTLLLLMFFLRSLLAPVYLLAASVLAVLATLGITTLLARAMFGSADLVYYVPFAAGVLLVSLGADYNVFVVGRIWEQARSSPVADAVAIAAPRASRAITTAGIALAASFALLAVIPLLQFRQIALAMAAGVVLDALVVRSLLVPALIALFGRVGMWPGRAAALPATLGGGG